MMSSSPEEPVSIEHMKHMRSVASESDAEAFEELIVKADSDGDDIRRIAVTRLMNLEDRRAVPVLIAKMEDPSAGVRGIAAIGLGHYGAAEARDVLIDHLRNDKSGNVRAMCAGSLGSVGGADDEIIRALDDPDWHVKTSATTTLNRLCISSAADHIGKLLDDQGEWSVRYFAAMALLDFGISNDKVIDTLKALREDTEVNDTLRSFAESDIWLEACDKFADEVEEIGEYTPPDEVIAALREKHGEEAVPQPPEDPLGDIIAKAKRMKQEQS